MRNILFIVVVCLALPARGAEALPKVALLGDSIRLSYAPTVVARLKGHAVVISPQANGGDSERTLKNLTAWAIKQKPAAVHFNCGIHDTKYFVKAKRFQVPPDEYEANLRAIVKRLRAETGAVVLFATTTPIHDQRAAEKREGRDYVLTNDAVTQYNEVAVRVMRDLKVPVNDLNAMVRKAGLESMIDADGVHLTSSARERLGRETAGFIRRHLKKR